VPRGGCKDEHVKVEEEPTEGGSVVNGSAVGGGDDNGTYDQGLEVTEGGFIARSEEETQSCAEVWWFVVVD
jgi:hypothetical protein